MANVKKCDRCGKVYDRNRRHVQRRADKDRIYTGVSLIYLEDATDDIFDLCDECLDAFGDFMSFYKRAGEEVKTNE